MLLFARFAMPIREGLVRPARDVKEFPDGDSQVSGLTCSGCPRIAECRFERYI